MSIKFSEYNDMLDELFTEMVDPKTGLFIGCEAHTEIYDMIQGGAEDKYEQLLFSLNQEEADLEEVKNEIKRLERIKKGLEGRIKSKRDFALFLLPQFKDGKFKSAKISAWSQTTKQTKIDDITAIPEKYLRHPPAEAMAEEIKKAIENGEKVPGAHIENVLGLRKR